MEVAQAMDNSGSAKRRKVGNGELRLSSSKSVRITGRDSEDVVNTSRNLSDSVENKELSGAYADEMSFSSGDIPASCCSSNGSVMEKLKCADLEERAEIETIVRGNLDRRESKQIKTHILSPNLMAGYFSTPTNDFKEESGELQSLTTEKNPALIYSRRTVPPEKTPPAAELEEFFAAAENDLQNRFKDKYNYDVVNDVPLKGRFDWIQLKP
ncbi:hypothetical protein L1987_66071 [Smallanthus sonchifolius]|uniref:Uncharacterized protein n=1 Tax=Smallanthus sonchifolius TaxID=185202 RepID=A0ACB9BW45_9ASTR|nr:hypothetical protein L1987_66071 [Smallanthus sonchifolius]